MHSVTEGPVIECILYCHNLNYRLVQYSNCYETIRLGLVTNTLDAAMRVRSFVYVIHIL